MRSHIAVFIFGVIFMAFFAAVSPSVEKAILLMVGAPALAVTLLVSRFAHIGKLGAALPVVLAVLFVHNVEGSGNAAALLAVVLTVCVWIAKRPVSSSKKPVDYLAQEVAARHPNAVTTKGPQDFPWTNVRGPA